MADRIIGIDLGTSTSEVSVVTDGKPVLIPNKAGKFITPSVVHIGEYGNLFGEAAAEYLLTRPECTFMEVKRLTASGETLNARGKDYTPEEIQSLLIKYLAESAEDYLGESVSRAVITVPAYFNDAQRRATARAGELAGLEVMRIINEPTAAALDYGLSNLTGCNNILVFDFGGGTLDVTVLEMFEGIMEVKASHGNNRLGGKDFDEIVMRKLLGDFELESLADARARMRLKQAAELCKTALSSDEEYHVSLPFLYTGKNGKAVSVERTVTRAEFDEWINELARTALVPMRQALTDAGLTQGQLDIVLLVGGSTRIPLIRKLVADSLGIIPQSLIDPDLAVARGAAVQAALLEEIQFDGDGLVLTDVCPFTLGTETMQIFEFEDKLVFDPIIPRNTVIPVERVKTYTPYHDYQTSVKIKVFQGDSTDASQNDYLGNVELNGLINTRKQREPVLVTFAYDINGILQVTAKAGITGTQVDTVINTAGVKPKEEVDLSEWMQAHNARKFRPAIRKAEKLMEEDAPGSDEMELLIIRLKEALVLENEAKAEALRGELIKLMENVKEYV